MQGETPRELSIERVLAMMREEDRLVPREKIKKEIGQRIVSDRPSRMRIVGGVVLHPEFPDEFATDKVA